MGNSMPIAIIFVAWMSGAIATTVAVILADPGVFGALAIFAGVGTASGLLSAVAFVYRPTPRTDIDRVRGSGAIMHVPAHR